MKTIEIKCEKITNGPYVLMLGDGVLWWQLGWPSFNPADIVAAGEMFVANMAESEISVIHGQLYDHS